MPTIKYPKNPNIETAFVEQDDGTKNRVVMTAPQDISTLEYPSNPNSTKGYVTVDGKKQRVIMVADIVGGGGGGAVTSVNGKTGDVVLTAKDVDALAQFDTMPTAASTNEGDIVQFTGTTDANYTNGYFYKCVSDGQEPATYSWTQVNVQPAPSGLPDQTGQSGKFLTTDGTNASWSDKPLVNTATGGNSNNITVLGTPNASTFAINIGTQSQATQNNTTAVGSYAKATGTGATAFGRYTTASGSSSVCLGNYSTASGAHSIVIGLESKATANDSIEISTYSGRTNSDANTFKVGNANGNYEIMSADGTIPTDRFTTTPSADGTYYPTLSISSGTPTRSWGTINALQNTATGTNALAIGNSSTAIAYSSIAIGDSTHSEGWGSISIGYGAWSGGNSAIAIGQGADTRYRDYAIQIGYGTPSADGIMCVGLYDGSNWNNYKLLDNDGTIPADRLASTTGLADGNYRLRLVMASGVPTLEWVAE